MEISNKFKNFIKVLKILFIIYFVFFNLNKGSTIYNIINNLFKKMSISDDDINILTYICTSLLLYTILFGIISGLILLFDLLLPCKFDMENVIKCEIIDIKDSYIDVKSNLGKKYEISITKEELNFLKVGNIVDIVESRSSLFDIKMYHLYPIFL